MEFNIDFSDKETKYNEIELNHNKDNGIESKRNSDETNDYWLNFFDVKKKENISKKDKQLPDIFKENIKDIKWDKLLENKNIPITFFNDHYLDKIYRITERDIKLLSSNTNIPESFFEKYIEYVDWEVLSKNENISHTFFEKIFVRKNGTKFYGLDKVWWSSICENKNIPLLFFDKYSSRLHYHSWEILARHPNITPEFVEKYNNKFEQSWKELSLNCNLPSSFFEKYFDKINWTYLSCNKNIPYSFLKNILIK